MAVDEILLREIVRRVLTVARPEKIILFGSAATGQMTKDSDIDLLIVERAPMNRHSKRAWPSRTPLAMSTFQLT